MGVKMTTDEMILVAETRRRLKSGEARLLRLQAGVTLSEAATAAGISATSLWRYENSHATPRQAQALAYGKLLERVGRELQK
jgi:transcriptional regulator with XRE-family HTH domain